MNHQRTREAGRTLPTAECRRSTVAMAAAIPPDHRSRTSSKKGIGAEDPQGATGLGWVGTGLSSGITGLSSGINGAGVAGGSDAGLGIRRIEAAHRNAATPIWTQRLDTA